MPTLRIYLDESGVPQLTKPHPSEKYFVLSGVLINAKEDRTCQTQLKDFKIDALGNTNIVLHWIDMRYQRGDFRFLASRRNRRPFYTKLEKVYRNMPFCTVNVVMNIESYLEKYSYPGHPYHLSLGFIMDRAYLHALDHGFNKVAMIAESRDPTSNLNLQIAHEKLVKQGSIHKKGKDFRPMNFDLNIRDKGDNICGLQIADLSASIIRRTWLRKDSGVPIPWQYDFVKSKYRTNPSGNPSGWGLVEFPT